MKISLQLDESVFTTLHHRRAPAVAPSSPPCLRSTTAVQSRKCRLATLWRSRCGSTAVKCVTGRGKLLKTTGGVATVTAVLIKTRSGTAPPVWRGIIPPCNREKVDWRPYGDPVAVLLWWTGVTGRGKLWNTTGGVITVMAVLTKNRSGNAPPVWRGRPLLGLRNSSNHARGLSTWLASLFWETRVHPCITLAYFTWTVFKAVRRHLSYY